MNAEKEIRELTEATLADNHRTDGVRFVDELLVMASQVGKISCTFLGERSLRFQVQDQPSWELQLDRAKSKLRMLCARLGVLCNETGSSDVSIYGGKGLIRKEMADRVNNTPAANRSPLRPSQQRPDLVTWEVVFQNTPSAQEFTISLL